MSTAEDFAMEKFKWVAVTGIVRVSAWMQDDAAAIAGYVDNLVKHNHGHDHDVADKIDQAITTLTSALLAVKLSKNAYARLKPQLEAAE